MINYTIKTPPDFDGYFEGDTQVPGLEPDNNGNDDFAVEIVAWLQLSAGTHRFGVRCDDGYRLVAGGDYMNPSAAPLAFHNGGPADETVDFVASKSGFYPFRMVWYQRGGGGYLEWFSVNPATGNRTLINDSLASGAIKAYAAVAEPVLQLFSSDKAAGPYVLESGAVMDAGNKTITVPVNGQIRFYRLKAPLSLTISSGSVQGQNLILRYQ